MLIRPPPPEHSAVVDGYRDVTSALSTDSSNQQLVFGRIQPQATEESTLVPSPELVANVTGKSTENATSDPRLPSFTVGITQEDRMVTVKGRKLRKALTTGGPASAGDSSIGGIVDRINPDVTLQFGSFPPLDVTPGSISGPAGASDQVGPAELDSLRSDTGDEWQVRDFGYGFGPMSGSGNAAAVVRDEIHAREQRRVREQSRREEQERRQKEEQERKQKEEQERENSEGPPEQPRRGSFNGSYERGGYLGRRGRGTNGGYGRGYGRGFSRGGYSQYPRQQQQQQPQQPQQQQQQQYSATPPGQFSPLPPHATHGYSPDQSVYFLPPPPPPPPSFGSYHPGGYEVYQYATFPPPPALYPPVPQPVSQLPFPLDPTRYYLLGQLEYYLSPQNMAQDFYLRQHASTAY